MSEKITVLESLGLYLTKRFMADGRVLSYDSSASFHTKEIEVKSLKGVAQLLRKLHKNPHRCVIRGKFVGEDKAEPGNVEGTWSRTKGNFLDQPLHWFMVDIDAFAPFAADPVREVEAAIDEFMVAVLPPAFRRASYYWHLSSSAQVPRPFLEQDALHVEPAPCLGQEDQPANRLGGVQPGAGSLHGGPGLRGGPYRPCRGTLRVAPG